MTLVQSLSELEQKLTLWCMGVEPVDDQELERFAEVLAARARISQLVHLLELNRAQWASRDVAQASRVVEQTTRQIDATAREARHGKQIVDAVADVVRIATEAAAVGLGL
jgi:molybdenum cofactor biosynthesis enzyme MoaA